MTAKELFAKNLRFLRCQSNQNYKQMSVLLGVSRERYATWEYGTGTPNYNFLVAIADLFEVGIDNLLTCDIEEASK